MIERDPRVEEEASRPIARFFVNQDLALAYILGLEDALRAINIPLLFPDVKPYDICRKLMEETRINHGIDFEKVNHLRVRRVR